MREWGGGDIDGKITLRRISRKKECEGVEWTPLAQNREHDNETS